MLRAWHWALWLSAILSLSSARSDAVTISFTGLTDNQFANGEIVGTEFVPQGLNLTTTGIAFNVGCGSQACLGADRVSVDDFTGTLIGDFVLPNTMTDAVVGALGINFCCESNPGATITQLYGASGNLVATFNDVDVVYNGATPISYFRITFGYDAMYNVTYDQIQAVPEPSTPLLIGLGLAIISMARRRSTA